MLRFPGDSVKEIPCASGGLTFLVRSNMIVSTANRYHTLLRTEKNNRVTPAIASGVTDRPWTVEDVVALLYPPVATKRGPYRPRNSN